MWLSQSSIIEMRNRDGEKERSLKAKYQLFVSALNQMDSRATNQSWDCLPLYSHTIRKLLSLWQSGHWAKACSNPCPPL
jgi:hypothetical protein